MTAQGGLQRAGLGGGLGSPSWPLAQRWPLMLRYRIGTSPIPSPRPFRVNLAHAQSKLAAL
jgi:hypothetical protein